MNSKLTAEKRRWTIIECAAAVFQKYGFEATRVRDIAELCGINEALIYKHFKSKEELFQAALSLLTESLQDRWAKVAATITDIRQEIDARKPWDTDYYNNRDACRATVFKNKAFLSDKKVARQHSTRFCLVQDMLENLVRKGQREGVIRTDADPGAISCMIRGLGLFVVMSGAYAMQKRFPLEELASFYDEMLVALSPPAPERKSGKARIKTRVQKATGKVIGARSKTGGKQALPIRSPSASGARQKSDDRRSSILRVAVLEFSRKGYEKARLKDIALASDVDQAIVYTFFPSKDDLYLESMDSLHAETMKAMRDKATKQKDGFTALHKTIRYRILNLCSKPENFAGLMKDAALTTSDERFDLQLQEQANDAQNFVEELVRNGQADGSIRDDVGPIAIACWIRGFQMLVDLMLADDLRERFPPKIICHYFDDVMKIVAPAKSGHRA